MGSGWNGQYLCGMSLAEEFFFTSIDQNMVKKHDHEHVVRVAIMPE